MSLTIDNAANNLKVGPEHKIITLAGATGDLGQRIAHHLVARGATVNALVRKGSDKQKLLSLSKPGISIIEVDYNNSNALIKACNAASCVVSAFSGLRDVIVDTQTQLLIAAVKAGVPRFISSDYCIDYTKLSPGTNRNLDLRREFSTILDKAPINATSIFNGMFTHLLTGQAPVILFGLKRIVYWGDADQTLDFTTINDTAEFTAAAALDSSTPRLLRIAGEVTTTKGLKITASEVTEKKFKLFRAGSLRALRTMIKITRTLLPKKEEVFPPWQGMQYLHDMFTGLPKLNPLDNHRYHDIKWTSVKKVLEANEAL